MRAKITHPVDLKPDLQGQHGQAWLCNLAAGHAEMKVPPEQDATICHWVVEAAWAHPAWHSYSLHCAHLRPIPNQHQPIKFYVPGATHELVVFALDPQKERKHLIETGIVGKCWLTPPNFAAQFIEFNDDTARERISQAVQAIVDGRLSPDTDFMQSWADLFGSGMVKQ